MYNNLELNNNLKINNNLEKEQNNFLESNLGKTINFAIDTGLRMALPDIIEDEVINVKNAFIGEGLKEGINQAINSAINFGKSAIGIISGNFENLSQAHVAIKNGGIIDNMSNLIDVMLSKATLSGLIPNNISTLIKSGKNIILDNISKNIEDSFNSQINGLEKLSKYENNWNNYFNNKDFEGMEREYNKIEEKLKELLPLENTLKEARKIENLHMIIKNNNGDFDISKEQIELANILV